MRRHPPCEDIFDVIEHGNKAFGVLSMKERVRLGVPPVIVVAFLDEICRESRAESRPHLPVAVVPRRECCSNSLVSRPTHEDRRRSDDVVVG